MKTFRQFALRAALALHAARNFFGGLLFLILLAASSARSQTPDLYLNPGSAYVDVGRGIPWGTSFNRTYVLVPNSPNSSVCVYVVNNNPTSSHTFTLAVAQSADPRVTNFSSNLGRFQSAPVQGSPSPVAAGTMTSAFVVSTAAAEIALQFSGSSPQAGSPDTADLFMVQTSNSSCGTIPGVISIQGAVANGAPVAGENPVAIGAQTTFGNVGWLNIDGPSDVGSGDAAGLMIGDAGLSDSGVQVTNHNVTLPNGPGGGVLAIEGFQPVVGGFANIRLPPALSGGNNNGRSEVQPQGLYTSTAGFERFAILTGVSTGTTTVALWNEITDAGAFSSCYATLVLTAVSGTGPTLDVYLQDGDDGSTWTDRIHFTQATGVSKFFAGIAASQGITPTAMTDATLAVSTKVDGPIGSWGRFKLVVAGTSPSFTGSAGVVCK